MPLTAITDGYGDADPMAGIAMGELLEKTVWAKAIPLQHRVMAAADISRRIMALLSMGIGKSEGE